jgi:uncharacterized protein
MTIWRAACRGDLTEVERLVGHERGLLEATDHNGRTPLILAAYKSHVEVVRWLLDRGVGMNHRDSKGGTALWYASREGHTRVVRLLVERGADPTIATTWGATPLIRASSEGHLEVVGLLLGHCSAKTIINRRNDNGRTALWKACQGGHGGVARALLESGADPTIATIHGNTPMAIAKHAWRPEGATAEGRRECIAALEVRPLSFSPLPQHLLC